MIKYIAYDNFRNIKDKRKKTGKQAMNLVQSKGRENLGRVGESDRNDAIIISKLLAKSSFPLFHF